MPEKNPIEAHDVESSNLDTVLYDYGESELYIRFHGNRIYVYYGVPARIFHRLLMAPSHGSYHYYNIRMSYPYEELTSMPAKTASLTEYQLPYSGSVPN